MRQHWQNSYRSRAAVLLATCAGTILLAGNAFGASTTTSSLALTYEPVRLVSVNNVTLSFSPTSAQIFAQETGESADYTTTVRANSTWFLKIKGQGVTGGFWTRNGSGNATKPISDLKYKVGAGSYQNMPTNDTTVANGSATVSQTVTLKFKSTINFQNDTPDNYGCTVVFTMSAS